VPKITGPCDWNGTDPQNINFSSKITAYFTSNDITGTGKGTWIRKFSAQQVVIATFSTFAGACKILRPQFVKFA